MADDTEAESMRWCKCAEPDSTGDEIATIETARGHADFAVCGACCKPIANTRQADLKRTAEIPNNEFPLNVPASPFANSGFSPWASGLFAGQADWLKRKRAECQREGLGTLDALGSPMLDLSTKEMLLAERDLSALNRGLGQQCDHLAVLIKAIEPAAELSWVFPYVPVAKSNDWSKGAPDGSFHCRIDSGPTVRNRRGWIYRETAPVLTLFGKPAEEHCRKFPSYNRTGGDHS